MRELLKNERIKNKLTQKKVSELLNISLRHYQAIELGSRLGSIKVWDKLEELFKIPQQELRRINSSTKNKGN